MVQMSLVAPLYESSYHVSSFSISDRFSHTFANSIWIRYPFFASDIVTRSTIQTFSARLPLFVSDYPATSPGNL